MSFKSNLKKFYQKKIKKMSDSDILIDHLRRIGTNVGDGCFIFSEKVETTEPYLVSIGNNVTISYNVSFNTHDDSVEAYYKKDTLIVGKITIGSDCFIGVGSTILPGVKLADKCIVGAGSVVTKSFEEGSVIAGVPAKKICNTDELYEKNKKYIIDTTGKGFKERKEYILSHQNVLKKV